MDSVQSELFREEGKRSFFDQVQSILKESFVDNALVTILTKSNFKMKLAIFTLASLFASAAAFAPIKQPVASTSLNAFEGELGDQAPLGYWDPLGLSEEGDFEKFERYRYVELKHGRICMLAFLGEIVTRAGIHLPGQISYSGPSFGEM